MKVKLLTIGKTSDKLMIPLIQRYVERLSHMAPFVYTELPDVRCSKSAGEEKQKELEGKYFLASLQPSDILVLLDEHGKGYTSRQFAEYLDSLSARTPGNIVFVIGGPYGFSQEMYNRANVMMRLTEMTLTHEMARLVMTEQLYRAYSIMRGLPYHHD